MPYAPPTSQVAGARPIAFLLDDQAGVGPPVEPVTLSIRPESLTRQDTSRMAIQQTLGGAWADNFGPGLARITISGHTGWRRNAGQSAQSNGEDGEARFLRLRDTVFAQWHSRREAATKSGQDPNKIQLIFADDLDKFTAVVAPELFNLQRSRSRPLLMQYQINMVVLADGVGTVSKTLPLSGAGDILRTLGLNSLADTIDRIEAAAKDITSLIDRSLGAPVRQFMQNTVAIYKRVDSAVRSVEGVASSLIDVAQNASRAGMNVFRTIGLVASLPQRAKARIMEVAAAYSNAFCLFRNAIKKLPQYDDYDSIYGASNCSSTGGGRPISPFARVNTLAAIALRQNTGGVRINQAAQTGLQALARSDVVLSPPTPATLISSLQQINLGLAVA